MTVCLPTHCPTSRWPGSPQWWRADNPALPSQRSWPTAQRRTISAMVWKWALALRAQIRTSLFGRAYALCGEVQSPLFPIAALHGSTAPAAAILHDQQVCFRDRLEHRCRSLSQRRDLQYAAAPVRSRRSRPTTRDRRVTSPAPMMATLAIASLRADRNAARVSQPLWAPNRANRKAQSRWTTNAPAPVMDNANGSGGTGLVNLPGYHASKHDPSERESRSGGTNFAMKARR